MLVTLQPASAHTLYAHYAVTEFFVGELSRRAALFPFRGRARCAPVCVYGHHYRRVMPYLLLAAVPMLPMCPGDAMRCDRRNVCMYVRAYTCNAGATKYLNTERCTAGGRAGFLGTIRLRVSQDSGVAPSIA